MPEILPAGIPAAAVVSEVVRRLPEPSRTRWVGVDGGGASGKTTLAAAIAAALPGAVVVHVDDFARPGLTGWDRGRFVVQVLRPLLAGRLARYQRWDWLTDTGAEWHRVPPGVPVVVEGVSSTDLRLGVPWDVTVWIEVPYAIRLALALERDGPGMAHQWLTDWMPSEEAYVAAQHPEDRVDLVWRPTAPG